MRSSRAFAPDLADVFRPRFVRSSSCRLLVFPTQSIPPTISQVTSMHLQELKRKSPAELLAFAEENGIENASNLRRQDLMFAILKILAEKDTTIDGDGVLEILQDGFGFLRSPEASYLPGPDDIYVSPS